MNYIHLPLEEEEVATISNIWLLPKKFPKGSKVQILPKGTLNTLQQLMVGKTGIVVDVDIVKGWIDVKQQRSVDSFMQSDFYEFQLKRI